jgi:hypothetical protein
VLCADGLLSAVLRRAVLPADLLRSRALLPAELLRPGGLLLHPLL